MTTSENGFGSSAHACMAPAQQASLIELTKMKNCKTAMMMKTMPTAETALHVAR